MFEAEVNLTVEPRKLKFNSKDHFSIFAMLILPAIYSDAVIGQIKFDHWTNYSEFFARDSRLLRLPIYLFPVPFHWWVQ